MCTYTQGVFQMTAQTTFAATLFPPHTKHSGAAAVIQAADTAAATHQRLVDFRANVIELLGIPIAAPDDVILEEIKALKWERS
jgi:hypothetical protein